MNMLYKDFILVYKHPIRFSTQYQTVLDLHFELEMRVYLIRLLLRQTPLRAEVKPFILDLRICWLSLLKIPYYLDRLVSTLHLWQSAENPGVQDPHQDVIDSGVRTMENEEAVWHEAVPHIDLWIALVAKLIFKKNHFSIMHDRVVLTKHVKRNFNLRLMIKGRGLWIPAGLCYYLINLWLTHVDLIVDRAKRGNSPFVRSAESPVKGLLYSFEILNLAHILLLP